MYKSALSELMRKSREEKEREFYYEYGKFMCAFARVEVGVHLLFRRASGLGEDKARAIVAGESISNMMEFTKRLTNISKSKWSSANKKEIDVLFNQLSAISAFRNGLIHGGADVEEDTIRSINYNKAKTQETIIEMTFESSVIQAAQDDLMRINLRFFHLVKADQWTRKNIHRLRRDPWLYKPPQAGSYWGRLLAEALRRHPQLQA